MFDKIKVRYDVKDYNGFLVGKHIEFDNIRAAAQFVKNPNTALGVTIGPVVGRPVILAA